jgi:hypothetical protein
MTDETPSRDTEDRRITAPLPPPGWYPDPGGANTQRYFDGTKWGPLLPPSVQPKRPGPAKSPWPFVIMACAGPVTFIVTYFLMQLAFGAADSAGGALGFQIVGFVLFLVWLASIAATIVGIIGTVVRMRRLK